MGKCCIVYGCCSKTPELNVSFHVLPRDSVLRKIWILSIPRTRRTLKSFSVAYVCSLHFEESNFRYTKTGVRILEDGAVPTVFFSPKLAISAMKSRKRTFAARGNLNNTLSPLKKRKTRSPQNPVKLLLVDHMITSYEDETKMCEKSFIIYAGSSLPKKRPAFEAVHHINVKALLQHFHENVGDNITNISNDGVRKNVLFIRGGRELFAAVVEKSKNSSPGGGVLVLKDKYGGFWKTKHILRINHRPGRIIVKNVDFLAKTEDPNGVFPSTAVKTVSMIDDLTCSPSLTNNSEKCVTIINQKEDEVFHIRTLAEKGQMEKTDTVSNSEQTRHTRLFTEEEQMSEKQDVSSSEQTVFSPTKAGKLIIKNADLIATFEPLNDVSPSAAENTVSFEDDITSSAAPSTDNSEKCVATGLSQKDEEARHTKTFAEEMLGRKDVSRSEQANSSPAEIWELRFECDSCKINNEIVFMKPFKIATEFTIFLCPTEKCIYPLWVRHLYRFIFKNLPDGMLLPCNPDNAPTVHEITSIIRQSSSQNKNSPMSVP